MITKEHLDKHFKLHNKLVLYTKDNIKLVFTKEPHFHMSGGHAILDLMDIEDLTEFCNVRCHSLTPSENTTE